METMGTTCRPDYEKSFSQPHVKHVSGKYFQVEFSRKTTFNLMFSSGKKHMTA